MAAAFTAINPEWSRKFDLPHTSVQTMGKRRVPFGEIIIERGENDVNFALLYAL